MSSAVDHVRGDTQLFGESIGVCYRHVRVLIGTDHRDLLDVVADGADITSSLDVDVQVGECGK